jgi:hypothetical protein
MRMRVEHGIHPIDPLTKTLGPKIRCRIHDKRYLGSPYMNPRAETLIARVTGKANSTLATYHGNAMRSSGSQKCDFHLPHGFDFFMKSDIVSPCLQR